MPTEAVVHRAGARFDRIRPVSVGVRQLPLGEHEVEHPVEEVVLVRDVAVQGHRLEPELVAKTPHRHGLDTRTVGELDRGLEDALSTEWNPKLACHGLTSLRRTHILRRKLTT
jgi:hypothetical protein